MFDFLNDPQEKARALAMETARAYEAAGGTFIVGKYGQTYTPADPELYKDCRAKIGGEK